MIESKILEKSKVPLGLLTELQGEFKTIGKKELQKLKNSIEKNGFIQPFFIWKDGDTTFILDGHQRKKAISEMYGNDVEVDCLEIKAKNKTEAKKLCLYFSSQYGTFSKESFIQFTGDIDFSDLADFNFPKFQFFEADYQSTDTDEKDDVIPDTSNNSKNVVIGDLFQLGNHRLLCGDSTNIVQIDRLMNKSKIDMVFTSPPYNVGIAYNSHKDKMDVEKYNDMIADIINNIKRHGSENLTVVWNKGTSIHDCDFRMDIDRLTKVFNLNRVIVWKKKGITGPPIFSHTQKNPVVKNYMPFFGFEFLFVCQPDGAKGNKIIPFKILERRMTDVWEVSQSQSSSDQSGHPAAFPVELAYDAIEIFAQINVFEPFGGSGSTLIACEKSKRNAFVCEIDPHYCSIILERWEQFTGLRSEKIS